MIVAHITREKWLTVIKKGKNYNFVFRKFNLPAVSNNVKYLPSIITIISIETIEKLHLISLYSCKLSEKLEFLRYKWCITNKVTNLAVLWEHDIKSALLDYIWLKYKL